MLTSILVDPTGLKPAPHGLKGRCSVTRAPSQETGCGGRIRTFDSRINNPVPYQLGDATRIGCGSRSRTCRLWLMRPASRHCSIPASQIGGDEGSRTLIVRFTRPMLCYPVELHRQEFGGLGGIQTLTRSLQDFYALRLHHQPLTLVAVGGVEPPTSRL